MYKLFILLIVLSCDKGIILKGNIVGKEKSFENKTVNISIQLSGRNYPVLSNTDNTYIFRALAYGDTIKIFVNDLQYYSDTLQFTWDEYIKNKLWEKDLDIYIRKKES